jgi:hypothetical protein
VGIKSTKSAIKSAMTSAKTNISKTQKIKLTALSGKSKGSNLAAARAAKEDEFYTQLVDIERELSNYRDHFKGKVVYCNCDDPRLSGFVHYFSYNFEKLGLKKLIATCYKNTQPDLFSQHDDEHAIKLEYTGDRNGSGIPDPNEFEVELLAGDGDFRSKESVELLKQADVVVTNPPFSLYREYVAQLMDYDKKFIILGPQNAISYKEIFPLLKSGKMWLGTKSGAMKFKVPETREDDKVIEDDNGNKWQNFGNICWFTNLDVARRHEDLILYKTYNALDYPKYDNFNAIEVGQVANIPKDYGGIMGVPITFLDKHNPDQFEIVGITQSWFGVASKIYPKQIQVNKDGSKQEVTKLNDGAAIKVATAPKNSTYYIVGKDRFIKAYARILIQRRDLK